MRVEKKRRAKKKRAKQQAMNEQAMQYDTICRENVKMKEKARVKIDNAFSAMISYLLML